MQLLMIKVMCVRLSACVKEDDYESEIWTGTMLGGEVNA